MCSNHFFVHKLLQIAPRYAWQQRRHGEARRVRVTKSEDHHHIREGQSCQSPDRFTDGAAAADQNHGSLATCTESSHHRSHRLRASCDDPSCMGTRSPQSRRHATTTQSHGHEPQQEGASRRHRCVFTLDCRPQEVH